MLAVRTTLCASDYFTPLVVQQHGEQSTLRKRQS
jgi:hypothetical protein